MGLMVRVTGEVRATDAPWFRLRLNPHLVEIPYGSVSMVAEIAVTIERDPGHEKTVHLDLAGMAGQWSFSSDQFVYGVDAPVTLLIDMAGFAKGQGAVYDVVGYDDINDRPPGETSS